MLFNKKNIEGNESPLAEQVATLTEQNATLAEQVATLINGKKELEAKLANFETLEKLQAKANSLDFQCDVKALFAENGNDYVATLEAMIEGKADLKTTQTVEANTEEFLKAENNNEEAGEEDDEDHDQPTNRAEAVNFIASMNKCTKREATVIARGRYPHLFK
jgi:uncharacterized coiled-coil protein SlyX